MADGRTLAKIDLAVIKSLAKGLRTNEMFNHALDAQVQVIIEKVGQVEEFLESDLGSLEVHESEALEFGLDGESRKNKELRGEVKAVPPSLESGFRDSPISDSEVKNNRLIENRKDWTMDSDPASKETDTSKETDKGIENTRAGQPGRIPGAEVRKADLNNPSYSSSNPTHPTHPIPPINPNPDELSQETKDLLEKYKDK